MIKSAWKDMWLALAVLIPEWVTKRLKERTEGRGFAVKAIPIVIVLLSVASITNLATRAELHHAGFSSFLTGAGIAILVPIAVLATMVIEGTWKSVFWVIAVVFAIISGSIQFSIYHSDSTWFGYLEAISFGYGVPLSEVMLAVMESKLYEQSSRWLETLKKKEQEDKEAEEAKIAQQKILEEQHKMQEENRIRQQEIQEREQAAQQETNQWEEAQRREMRQQLDALKLEAEKLKVEAKRLAIMNKFKRNSGSDSHESKTESGDSGDSENDSRESKTESRDSIESKRVHQYFADNPGASQRQASKALKLSQPRISRIMSKNGIKPEMH